MITIQRAEDDQVPVPVRQVLRGDEQIVPMIGPWRLPIPDDHDEDNEHRPVGDAERSRRRHLHFVA
jgi:hypothetical protein